MKPKHANNERTRFARSRRVLAVIFAALLTLAPLAQAQQIVSTPLRFETRAQPLFGADSGGLTELELDLVFFEEHVPPTSKGTIERVNEELSVATLQTIWTRAMNECQSKSYTIPVIGIKISPTATECQNGEVNRKYCTFPPSLGWNALCPSGNRKTYIRDLGPGIGPKPTQPADRPFDVGAVVTYRADVEMGVRGVVVFDAGTVDVSFAGEATLATSVSDASPGDVVTITTGWDMNGSAADMRSRYPNIDFSLGSYVFTDVNAEAVYAAPDFDTGDQIRSARTLYSEQTLDSDLENVSADGVVEFADTEWFGLNISPAGLEVRVKEEGFTLLDGSDLISENILYPFQPKPRPVGAVGFSIADYSLLSPKLDTPAINGFDCGDCSAPPLRNFVDASSRIVNTTPVGQRTLFDGMLRENGSIATPETGDALQDADFFRFDLDMDSISVALGAPLGVTVEGPTVKFPKRLRHLGDLGPVIGINLDAVDMDVASFWSADQRLEFDPRVSVDLNFDKTVEVRLPGASEFSMTDSVTIFLGESVEFKQVEGGVNVVPVYSTRHNRFTNDTKLLVTLAYQQTLGGVELYGLVPELAEGVFDLPVSFAVSRITPQFADPFTIWSSQPDPDNIESYGLGGFKDLGGAPLVIAETGSGPNPGGGSGTGTGSGSTNGGGGGASGPAEIALLIALLLVTLVLRGRLLSAASCRGKRAPRR
jgi:hypothetical protein